MKTTAVKLAVIMTAAIAGTVVAPAAALAVPGSCTVGTLIPPYAPYGGKSVFCQSGTGSYREWVECWNDANHHARYYGSWENPQTEVISYAKCNATYPYLNTFGTDKK